MNKSLIITTLLGVFIHFSLAGSMNCGCAPGHQGTVGNQGIDGVKGERGDLGDPGIRGFPGIGLRGVKGARGLQGIPGAPPPVGLSRLPGPPGRPGPPGICGCVLRNPFLSQSTPFEQELQPGDYYLSDEYGDLNYLGDEYPEQYINSLTATAPQPNYPPLRQVERSSNLQPSSGLYMMGPNNVLIPVTNVNAYDLFATNSPEIFRPKPTTTAAPEQSHSVIYILGPKGSLIPLHALGINKQPFGPTTQLSSSYNKSLRDILMGEIESDYDDEFSVYTDDVRH